MSSNTDQDWPQDVSRARTVPEMFFARCKATPSVLAYKYHAGGGWHDVQWSGFEKRVREVAAGLLTLGVEVGDKVSVVGDTRPEWAVCDIAIMAVGAVSVGIYQTNTPQQTQYILEHSGSTVLFVDNQTQLEKIRLVREELPELKYVVVWDAPDGLDASLGEMSLYALNKAGRDSAEATPAVIEARARALDPDAIANLVYTSGTTGPPKGAMLTHANISALLTLNETVDFTDEDITLSFLPMCHVAEKVVSFYGRIRHGISTAFVRSLDFQMILEDIKTIRPTVFGAVPRIFEKVYARARMRAEVNPVRGAIFSWALGVGQQYSRALRGERRLSRRLTIQHAVADRIVFSKIREIFGGRVRVFITGAAPINVEILEFFHAAGMLVVEVYGMTETSGVTTANKPEEFKFGTVGKPLPGVEVKIAEDGEILVKGPTVFPGYYRNEEATTSSIIEAWMHTGDIGEFDADGFLKITDRKKNLIITSGGKNIAPQNIENLVKDDPYISQCVVIGDRRNFSTALITLDEDEAPALAEKLGVKFRGVERLVVDPKTRAHIEAAVERANAKTGKVERIQKFEVLPRDLTIDNGELTPTLKVKRQAVERAYQDIVDGMYGG